MITVQETLEAAFAAVTQEHVRVTGSGRTDAGAHALRQVIAFSTESALPASTLQRAVNAHLPMDVSVVTAEDVAADFHPRFDALARTYRYLIWNRPARSPLWQGRALHVPVRLDVDLMDAAARMLRGTHDFSSFVPVLQEGNRTREVFRAECRRDGDLVTFEIEATGFMRQMVRSIAGTLIRVGLGKLKLDEFRAVVASGARAAAGDTAPAYGLYLAAVRYALDADPTVEGHEGVQARRIEETA
jgi:tRNA pseudouridine38-40 synthase